MAEHSAHRNRIRKLLAQDPEINNEQMEGFRMRLHQSVDEFDRKARQTRRRIVTAWLVYLALGATWLLLMSQWGDAVRNPAAVLWRQWIIVPVVISIITSAVIALMLLVMYLASYSPRLHRARFDLQTSMLMELQQQVKQLRETMERHDW
jgi:hypothetical protein